MKTIDDAIEAVLANEGGYVNDVRDAGGETNFGITAAVARKQGYAGPMRAMPRSFAVEVYRRQYAVAPGFDKVAALSGSIAAELVDTGVNMGPAIASRFLVRALNALGDGGLAIEGGITPAVLAALKAFLAKRGAEGEARLLACLNGEQAVRYLDLVESRPANKGFIYGWLKRIMP